MAEFPPGSSPVNVVFMGNVTYPQGLAGTRRFQHFIDGVMSEAGNSGAILLLRQNHPWRDDASLSGVHRGLTFRTIGADIGPGPGFVPAIVRYLVGGLRFLVSARRQGVQNAVYHYDEPSLDSVIFLLWARLLGYRIIVDIVEDSHVTQGNSPLLSRLKARSGQWATRKLASFADGIITISTYLEQKLVRIVRGTRPVLVVPVSVDLDRFQPSAGGFHKPVRILYAGSFHEKDGVENLIDAFEVLASQRPDIELLMTGMGVPYRMAEIHRRTGASPFRERIHYTGFLANEDYLKVLGDSDVLCVVRVGSDFASRGFPFKLGEYLAMGRPVVASRVGDIEAFLTDRVNAVLVEPDSVAGIAAGLEFLCADEARGLAIGRAGRLVAEQHFNSRTNGRRLLAAIRLSARN